MASPSPLPSRPPAAPVLPIELAPSLRRKVLALLAEVSLADRSRRTPRADGRRRRHRDNRCVVCHSSGVLGGHHDGSGEIQWVHRSCHRRLHRRAALAS